MRTLSASKKLEAALAAYLDSGNFLVSTFTADAGTDVLTTADPHGFTVGDRIKLDSDDTLPDPLASENNYFIESVPSATQFTVALTSGGDAVDITDTGTGTHTVSYRPPIVAGSDSWVIYEGNTTGERKARFHVVVECDDESGPLLYAGIYDVATVLRVYRICKAQPGESMEPIQFLNAAKELLTWAFSFERNAIVKAALEEIDPTLSVAGHWPETMRNEGVSEAFVCVLPLIFTVCHRPSVETPSNILLRADGSSAVLRPDGTSFVTRP